MLLVGIGVIGNNHVCEKRKGSGVFLRPREIEEC